MELSTVFAPRSCRHGRLGESNRCQSISPGALVSFTSYLVGLFDKRHKVKCKTVGGTMHATCNMAASHANTDLAMRSIVSRPPPHYTFYSQSDNFKVYDLFKGFVN